MDRRGRSTWGLWLAVVGPVGAGAPCVADCTPGGETVIQVVLDLDAGQPGFQSNLNVPPATPVVNGVAIYVLDPAQQSCLWGIGYLGGIGRGVALGHMPDNANHGAVEGFAAHLGTPIVADNFAVVFGPPGLDPGFVGPEVQYVEGGGDAVPDGTLTIHGVDPDAPLPVLPATFLVDYIDGPAEGGPATITVLPLGDLDGDGIVGILDFLELLAAWGPCPAPCPPSCPADLDGDCSVGITDLLTLLANWG